MKKFLKPKPRILAPQPWKKLRIGLLGGSFNPAHHGHVHASEIAMTYLNLDYVWWLVSPGNPLKKNIAMPRLDARMHIAKKLVTNPRIIISDIEAQLGTCRTYDTVKALLKKYPHTEFVWLSGTDIAFEFKRWYRWRQLSKMIAFAFVGRPSKSGLVRKNVFREMRFLRHFYPLNGCKAKLKPASVFWLFGEPLNPLSSTLLRAQKRRFALKKQNR